MAAVLGFLAGLGNDFLYDDHVVAIGQRLAGITWGGLWHLLREPYWGTYADAGLFRPFSLLLLGVERLSFDQDPMPYHVVSLGLHVTASVLVWWLLRSWNQRFAALAAGLLFALHPLHAEAVLPAYGQSDLLAGCLVLLTLAAFVQGWWLVAVGLGFLAVGSKESAAVLPVLAALTAWASGRRAAPAWILTIPVAVYLGWRAAVLRGLVVPETGTISAGYPLLMKAKIVFLSLAGSVQLAAWPWPQSVAHHLTDRMMLTFPLHAVAVVFAAGVCLWLLSERIGRRRVVFAAGWFLAGWLPVSNIIPMGAFIGERFLYLPLLGVILAAVWALEGVSWRHPVVVLLLLVSAGLCLRTTLRWHDEESLWRSTLEDDPASVTAHGALGRLLLEQWAEDGGAAESPLFEEARRHLEEAWRLSPDTPASNFGMALVHAARGDCASARPFLHRAETRMTAEQTAAVTSRCP